jgi:hypothetical protein
MDEVIQDTTEAVISGDRPVDPIGLASEITGLNERIDQLERMLDSSVTHSMKSGRYIDFIDNN